MVARRHDLWALVKHRPQVDANDLAEAIAQETEPGELDYRTRLLIRDGVMALRSHWGDERWRQWLECLPQRARIEAVCREEFEREGFPTLRSRLVDKVDPENVKAYFREIGLTLPHAIRIDVAGSAALILTGQLDKATDDVDVVDEVPKDIREQHELLAELKRRYGLSLGHVQRHYFPARWQDRVHFLGNFGNVAVYVLDGKDVFISKLFSRRTKDLDDLRALQPRLAKDAVAEILKRDCQSMLASADLRGVAEKNWYVLYGERLPA